MNFFGSYPFLRPAVALASGIGLALFALPDTAAFITPLFISLIAFAALSWWLQNKAGFRWQWMAGICLGFAFLLAGTLLATVAQSKIKRDYAFAEKHNHIKFYRLKLDDELSEKANSWRAHCVVISGTDSSGREIRMSGNILVYFPRRSNGSKPALTYGDVIAVPNRVIPIPSAAFPGGFDFAAVMRYKNTGHQVFIHNGLWRKTGNEGNPLVAFSLRIRGLLIDRLHQVFQGPEAGLLASLLVGYKEELDQEAVSTFAKTGTMHILAVSGMHAGLLYVVLMLLFTGKRNNGRLRRWQSLMVILTLWLFALVTGLSASVIRAALMFSIIEAGRSLLSRKSNLINSLFASAFFQLLISPLSLIDTGFQLSYLAVLGIAVVYPWLAGLWMPPTKFLSLVYQSGLLSLSATIATLPVSLFYFKSFPVWFIPANILAVPLSTLLMGSGLISIMFSFIPWLGDLLVWGTSGLSDVLLAVTRFFSNLPLATIDAVHLNVADAFLLALFLSCAVGWLMIREKVYAYGLILGSLGLATASTIHHWSNRSMGKALVCELRGNLLLFVQQGRGAVVYSGPMRQSQADSLFRLMKDHCENKGIARITWNMKPEAKLAIAGMEVAPVDGNIALQSGGKKWLILLEPLRKPTGKFSDHQTVALLRHKKYVSGTDPDVLWLQNNFCFLE